MAAQRLPTEIIPLRLVESERTLVGRIPVSRMPRLRESLYTDAANAEIGLKFARDEAGTATIRGTVSADLELVCQRCLQPVAMEIESQVKLALVSPGADSPDSRYEPLEVGDEPVSLTTLIEDELLLAIPAFPKHQECAIPARYATDSSVTEQENPFAVLLNGRQRQQ